MFDGWFASIWPVAFALLQITVAAIASGHVVLTKRDVRGVIGWVGVIWLTPLLGSVIYVMFGINRIARKAKALRRTRQLKPDSVGRFFRDAEHTKLGEHVPDNLARLAEVGNRLTAHSLTVGNHVEPLVNGDEAFPAMLAAIDNARKSIAMCSYIFDNDLAGRKFVHALDAARKRGVEVRVLIDGVGSRYSWTPSVTLLRNRGVSAALFLPTLAVTQFVFANLRNHRKILVVDGEVGFTGGMNIRSGNLLAEPSPHQIQDIHFRLRGPVVLHLQASVANDWEFATGEALDEELWFPDAPVAGDMIARGIADGPDGDYDKLRLTYLAALSAAQDRVAIVTPYFLPDETLLNALNVAALRGVEVEIIIPRKNNLRMVGFATMATLPFVLERGCRVWLSPPPFDHSKLIVVDDMWCCFGSANWDSRSLNLNFEFNVECYDRTLAEQLMKIVEQKKSCCEEYSLADSQGRSLPVRLRDGAIRLLSPYL